MSRKKIADKINQDVLKYFINNPIFVRFSARFSLECFKWVKCLRTVSVNERIVEIPFAIQCLSNLEKGKKVLDLGCMESALALYLAGLGYFVTGVDFRYFPYYHPNFSFVQGDILNLSFEDESYDAVLGISTFEHIGIGVYGKAEGNNNDDEKAVAEACRVLKKDGIFCLTAPYGVASIGASQRAYSKDSLERLLKDFKVQEIKYHASFKDDRSKANYWKEIDQKEAANIKSKHYTNCICLVKALK